MAGAAEAIFRHVLEALTDMARAQADSIRAVTEAQADWVKGLASAKALPRNAGRVLPPAPARDDDDDDDDDDTDDDDEGDAAERDHQGSAPPAAPSWAEGLAVAMAPQIAKLVDALLKKYVGTPGAQPTPAAQPDVAPASSPPPPPPTAPAPRNAMTHLAAIMRGLNDDERAAIDAALSSRDADVLSAELLSRSVGDAIVFVREQLELRTRQARARRAARAEATPRAATGEPAEAAPQAAPGATSPAARQENESPSKGDILARAPAVAALLEPGERAVVLALITRLPPKRLDALAATLLVMSDEEAASWIREHMADLRAEAGL